ncbi:MAG: hypothetical protein IJ083_05985 [Clostridia bacterium]|nr:hypothetical protein [Clostridia bacterium]
MKIRLIPCLLFLLLLFSPLPSRADAKVPVLPEGDLHVMDVKLRPNQVWDVYTGPGPEYGIAGNGKARVSTRDWVQVLGGESWGRILVQYAISDNRLRIGWIDADALREEDRTFDVCCAPGERYQWRPCHLTRACDLTDDPLLSRTPAESLPSGQRCSYLCRVGEWAMVDVQFSGQHMRGFVPLDALKMDETRTSRTQHRCSSGPASRQRHVA